MMSPTDYLVERLISEQLRDHPRTRSIYNSDAMFHASVKLWRSTLQVAAAAMLEVGVSPWQIESVLRATLDRMLSDQVLAEHDAMDLAAALRVTKTPGA